MCGPLFLTLAGIGLLSVGTCLGFLTAAPFATGAEPAQLGNPNMAVSIPDETAELIRQQPKACILLPLACAKGRIPLGSPWRTRHGRCTALRTAFPRCSGT
jgi:hypothetical protein